MLIKESLQYLAKEYQSRAALVFNSGKDITTQQYLSNCQHMISRCQELVENPIAMQLMMIGHLKRNLAETLSSQQISLYNRDNEQVQLWHALNKEELFLKEGIRMTKSISDQGQSSNTRPGYAELLKRKTYHFKLVLAVLGFLAIVVLVLTLTGCVAAVEPVEDESYDSEDPALKHPTPYQEDSGPDHESCYSQYQEGPNGHLIEIPVECHPLVVDPYSQPTEELPHFDEISEEELVLDQL